MKRKLLLILSLIITALLVMPMDADAQARSRSNAKKKDNNKWAKNKLDLHQIHNFAMWGGGGYSGLVNSYNYDNTSDFVGGGGGLIGLGYEWHYKKFMLSVGPEFRIFSSQDKIHFSDTEHPFSIVGTDPKSPYVLPLQTKYYQFSNLKETQLVGQLMVPLMAGAQWEELAFPVYFMAGAKFGYTIMHSYSQKGDLTSYINDPAAYDPKWAEVRDLRTNKYKSSGSNHMGLDVAVSAEIGFKINPYLSADWNDQNEKRKHPWHMRAALFVDYGLPLNKLGTDAAMVTVSEADATTISLHQSKYATSAVNSLLVGAKFTAVLQLSRPKQKKPQNPYMVLQLVNGRTGEKMVGNDAKANIEVKNIATGRVVKRSATNAKGMFIQRFKPDAYEVAVAKDGFLPFTPLRTELLEEHNNNLKARLDTTMVVLYPIPVFQCKVRNVKTGDLIDAHVAVFDTTTNHQIVDFAVTHNGGTTRLPIGETYYKAMVQAKDFQTQLFDIGRQGMDDIAMEFALEPIEKGRTYVIKNLFFATDKTEILPQSEPAMQELFEFLDQNPSVRIRIVGHTDWEGSDQHNQILSEGRANSVKRTMVERGIDPDRIETEGRGESQPVDTNETEEGRQNNRRVEFTILGDENEEAK